MWNPIKWLWTSALEFLIWCGRKQAPCYRMVLVQDPPDFVAADTLYLVGEYEDYWQAVLACPCGCKANIQLPMSPNTRPQWKFSGTNSKPTLTPSVWRKSGCRSHFILRNGKVNWCK